jgi:hypothetical protein
MNNKDTIIISLLKGIDDAFKNAGSSGGGNIDPIINIKLNTLSNDVKDAKSNISNNTSKILNNISKINDLNQKII